MKKTLSLITICLLLSGCNLYDFEGRLNVNESSQDNPGLVLQGVTIPAGLYQETEVKLDVDRKTQVARIEVKFDKGTLVASQRKFEIEVGNLSLQKNQGMQTLLSEETGLGYDIRYNLRNEVYRSQPRWADSCFRGHNEDCYEEQIVYDYAYLNFVLLVPSTDVEIANYAGSDVIESVEEVY